MDPKILHSFYPALKIYSSQLLTKLTGISMVIHCPCSLPLLQDQPRETFIKSIFTHSIAIQSSSNVQLLLHSIVILLFKTLDQFLKKHELYLYLNNHFRNPLVLFYLGTIKLKGKLHQLCNFISPFCPKRHHIFFTITSMLCQLVSSGFLTWSLPLF